MRNTWRTTIATMTAATLALSLSACSPGGTSGDDTFTIWWYEAADSAMGVSWQSALDEFKAEHPDLNVVFELKTWEQLEKAGQMVLNSDSAPDLLEYPKGNATLGAVSKAGLVADLSEVSQQRGWDTKLSEALLRVSRYEDGLMGSGNIYGIPVYGEYVALYYHEDALKEIGKQAPTTMAELEEIMEAFVKAGKTPLALGGAGYPLPHLVGALALEDADRDWLGAYQFFDGDVQWQGGPWQDAAEKTAERATKGYIGKDANGIDQDAAGLAFQDGTYPLFLSGSWWDSQFKANIDGAWSKVLLPEANFHLGSGGNVWAVPTNSTQKELAYDFIDLTLDAERQELIANSGGVPAAAELDSITDPVGRLAAEQFAQLVETDSLGYYPDWPVPGLYDVLLSNSQGLVSGSVSPETFVSNLETAYEAGRPQP